MKRIGILVVIAVLSVCLDDVAAMSDKARAAVEVLKSTDTAARRRAASS